MSELSDELLVAYVDGHLARDQSVAVKRVIDFDEVASQRVTGLRHANTRLEEAFDAMLREHRDKPDEETEEPDAQAEQSARAMIGRDSALAVFLGEYGALVLMAGALTLLLLGVGAGYVLTGGAVRFGNPAPTPNQLAVPGWQKEITLAQGLYGREAFEVSLESQANPDLVRFQLAGIIGDGVMIPDLEAQGLHFARAQILRRSGEAIAQIFYLPAEGSPIALYAKTHKPGQTRPRSHADGGVRTRAWVHKGIAYVLAAELSEGEIDALASTIEGKTTAH